MAPAGRVELSAGGLRIVREAPIRVRYSGRIVGFFRADYLVEDRVIVEVKAGQALTPSDYRQLRNYLRATATPTGLLLYFGRRPKVYRVTT
jgi:GxxExxY protein